MRAGKLDSFIMIERKSETIADSGSVAALWHDLAFVRAEIVKQAANEFLTGFGEAQNGTVIFRVRYVGGITTADRIIYDGRAHDIKEIVEIGRRRGLELRATAVS